MMERRKPVIALCNVGMKSYNRNILVQMVKNSISELNKECEVVYSGEIFDISKAVPTAQRVLRENPDILVILFSTWVFAPIPIAVIQESGVKYEVGPMETTLEGTLDELLEVVKEAHRACFVEGVEHVVTLVKIGESVHGTSIEGKVSKYR